MPLFRYRALASNGKSLKGVIDADSLSVAKERLRRQQLFVTGVSEENAARKERSFGVSFLLTFTRELSHLLAAGLPLYDSLLTLEEKYRRHKAHSLLLDLCDHLKEGHPFSSGLKRYRKTFDPIYLSMVQVAEETGDLAAIFSQLAQLIERQHKLKKQLISSLSYPCLLAVFCICVSLGLFLFVIPTMKELFEGRSLHAMTRIIVSLSDFINQHLTTLSLLVSSFLGALIFLWRRPAAKTWIYRLCLKCPLIKTVLLHTALVRLCRALAMLLTAGVPLLEALHLVPNVVKNPLLVASLSEATKKIVGGEPLSKAFKEMPLIPSLVTRLTALAEETGKMREAFAHLSFIYEEEVERHLAHLTTFLQPILLITLGMIVGLVILSILLPLTDVGSFVTP